MSHRFGRSGRIGAVALTAGLVLGGFALASTSASSSTFGPRTLVLPLDHFLCYHVAAKGFVVPKGVELKDFLQPFGFTPTVGMVATHCNPAVKQVGDAATGQLKTYKVVHPKSHLLCWAITEKASVYPVHLVNQFGTSNMMTTAAGATRLCVPSWKKRSGPPDVMQAAPKNLDHFACYPVVTGNFQYGFTIPSIVKAQDEFSFPKFNRVQVGIANLVCIPATKIVGTTSYPPATPTDMSLTCYPITPTPYWKSFFDQNQFGTGRITPKVSTTTTSPFEELCVPTSAIIG
jgi:hypothetical protein